jgi:cytoskeleton-associated protein 5
MVKLLSLSNISAIATGMGKPFEKFTKLFVVPVCTILSDQKAPTRKAAANTLTAIGNACEGLEPMIAGFATSLENPNPLLRSSLLEWLIEQFGTFDPAGLDLTSIVAPVISCLEDRSPDVRKQSLAILPILISAVGYDYAMEQTSTLKPAMKQTVIPLIQKARASAPALSSSAPSSAPASPPAPASKRASVRPTTTPSAPTAAPAVPPPPAAVPAPRPRGVMGALPKANPLPSSTRPPSRDSDSAASRYRPASALRRPGSTAPSISSRPSSSRPSTTQSPSLPETPTPPFRTSDPGPKASRLKKDSGRWVFSEKVEPHQLELLAAQMEPHASPELYSLLFSRDHNASVDFLSGLALLDACWAGMAGEAEKFGMDEAALRESLLANLDLILKYTAVRMYDSNTQAVSKALDVVANLINDLSVGETSVRHAFDESEQQLILPTLIFKVSSMPRRNVPLGPDLVADSSSSHSPVLPHFIHLSNSSAMPSSPLDCKTSSRARCGTSFLRPNFSGISSSTVSSSRALKVESPFSRQ